MSIAAGLCSHLLMTREARLGLNGPQVIEQEAGIEEYDSGDRPFIWSLSGGEQRAATGLADLCIEDDSAAIREQVLAWLRAEATGQPRCEQVRHYLERLACIDAARQATAEDVRALYTAGNPA
jgi:malonate decarboxylase beta subunit